MTIKTIIAIGAGGFIGAISRAYLVGFFSKSIPWHGIPVGTLGVNILGSFIIGLLFSLFSHTDFFSPTVKSFLSTGLLGALTTYSTFALENFIMLQHGQYADLTINVVANVLGTLIAVILAYTLMTAIIK